MGRWLRNNGTRPRRAGPWMPGLALSNFAPLWTCRKKNRSPGSAETAGPESSPDNRMGSNGARERCVRPRWCALPAEASSDGGSNLRHGAYVEFNPVQDAPQPEVDGELPYVLRLVFGSAMLLSVVLGVHALRRQPRTRKKPGGWPRQDRMSPELAAGRTRRPPWPARPSAAPPVNARREPPLEVTGPARHGPCSGISP